MGERGLATVLVAALAAQVVPYGRDHTNPPVVAEPQWGSSQTRDLAVRACFDCHSNETEWPWYTNIAPVSWLIQSDVDEGREGLNFSEWDREQEGEEAAETVREGSMPPNPYLLTHPTARLTEAELAEFIDGLLEMFGDGEEGDDD
ncbi:MAG: heme-binding domain-containing protein [Acidimicrobiia bacterium]